MTQWVELLHHTSEISNWNSISCIFRHVKSNSIRGNAKIGWEAHPKIRLGKIYLNLLKVLPQIEDFCLLVNIFNFCVISWLWRFLLSNLQIYWINVVHKVKVETVAFFHSLIYILWLCIEKNLVFGTGFIYKYFSEATTGGVL